MVDGNSGSENCGWVQKNVTKATDNKYLGKNRNGKKGEIISSEVENYDI